MSSSVCHLSLSSDAVRQDVSFYVAVLFETRCLLPPAGVSDSHGRSKGVKFAGLALGGDAAHRKAMGQQGSGAEGAKQLLPLVM